MRKKFFLFLAIGLLIAINLSYAGWVMRRPMRYPRYGAMVAAVNNRIYAIGGMVTRPDTAVRWVEEYNPVLDSWITKAPMPGPRALGVCGVVNGKIYVIGGIRTRTVLVESCEVYDPVLNQWQRRQQLPTHRYEFNGGVIGESIYVAGGYFPNPNPGYYTDTLEVYNTSQNSWFIRHSMSIPRVEFGAAVANNKLYTIGGYYFSYQNANEEYDPADNTWRMRGPLPVARSGLVCATLDNKIYAIGGQRYMMPRTIYARVDKYNVATDSWSLAESLNVARVYPGAVTINNHIYVVGGLNRNNNPLASLEEYTPMPGIEEIENQIPVYSDITISPNPFKYQTTIQLSKTFSESVLIKVFDLSGKVVKTIYITEPASGRVVWDGTDESHRKLIPGVYFVKINDDLNQNNRLVKLILLK